MLDTGLCAAALAEDTRFASSVRLIADTMSLSVDQARRLIAYAAAIHNCYGKASPGFQKKMGKLSETFQQTKMISCRDNAEHFRHERYGERGYLDQAEAFHVPETAARMLGSAIRYHHQGNVGEDAKPKVARDAWNALGNELHAASILVFDPPLKALNADCRDCSAAVMTLLPLVILSDWLASSEPFSELDETLSDQEYLAASARKAEETVRRDGLWSDAAFPKVTAYRQLWPAFSEEALRPVQRTILREADPTAGLTIIEAPMGEGKTEAGAFQAARLCSLWQKQGVYFALPTAATSNQMHRRVTEMLANLGIGGPRLMHGMAWLVEQGGHPPSNDGADDRAAACDWLQPLRRAMLAENAVGTVDQAMMAAMTIRYGCLRLLGLSGKVLVIDKIHAYDAYMSEIIERLLAWCRTLRIPVILLSATLTMAKRKALVKTYGGSWTDANMAYPLVTQVSGDQTRQLPVDGCAKEGRFRFEPLRLWRDPHAIALRAVRKVEHGGCLCVMMNTVAEAQAVYREVSALADEDTTLLLFHARFKARIRDELERRCIRLFGKDVSERPAKAILVCTQVVEQSLDVDFDGMITAIAPIDLLLQRAGRVHRHDRGKRPEGMEEAVIEVLVPDSDDFAETGSIYAPWLLTQTKRLLPRTVRIPQDVRQVIEAVYEQPETLPETWAEMMFSDSSKKAQAGGCMLPMPDAGRFFGWDRLDENFSMEEPDEGTTAKTRLSDCSVRVALLPEADIGRVLAAPFDAGLAREALGSSFTIRESPALAKTSDVVLEGQGLTKRLLLVAEEALPVRIGNTTLSYDETLGAITERKAYG